MKIVGIIFTVVAVGVIIWSIVNWVKGWQAENELMAPNGQKDDMEAADKRKKSR